MATKRKSCLHQLLILGLLGLVTCLLYANSLENGFVLWDDPKYITENPLIRELSWHNLRQIFSSIVVENYTPLTILSYALDYSLWGMDPRGYHITNLVLYLIDSMLVYLLASRVFQHSIFALLSALIFLTHPLHVESVTWLSARKDVLSLAFFLISFLLFVQYLEVGKAKGERRKETLSFPFRPSPFAFYLYIGALLCLVLALLSKATTLTLPLILVLYDHCLVSKFNRQNLWLKLRVYIPFFIIAGLLTCLHIKVSHIAGVIQEYHGGSSYLTLLTIPKVFWGYLQLFLFPVQLSAWYEIPVPTSALDPSFLWPLLGSIIVFGLTLRAYTLSKRVFFAIGWFFITLLPVSNLIPTSTLLADRYMFIPSIGLSILLGIALENLYHLRSRLFPSDFARRGAMLGSVFLLLFYSVLTIDRNTVWFNDYTLWSDAVQKSPNSYLAHHNLALAYARAGWIDAAIEEYEKALKIKPNALGAHYNLGLAYAGKNQLDQAEIKFQEVIALSPWHVEAHYNLGLIYSQQGRWDEALRAYQKALELKPDFIEAHNNLGAVYYQKGLLSKAIEEFDRALQLDPDHAKARNNLEMAYSQKSPLGTSTGKSEESIKP